MDGSTQVHDNNNKNMISPSLSPLSITHSHFCPLSPLPTPLPPQLPKFLWFTHLPTKSPLLSLPLLYSRAINSSRVFFFFFFFFSSFFQSVPTMRLCLLLGVLADKALTHITPSFCDHSQRVLYQRAGEEEEGKVKRREERPEIVECLPSSVLPLYTPFSPSRGDD